MQSKKGLVFLPTLTWLVVVIFSFIFFAPFYLEYITSDYWVFFVILTLVERLAIGIGIVEICKKHTLNSDRWFLVSLISGVNALLFINIWLWCIYNEK